MSSKKLRWEKKLAKVLQKFGVDLYLLVLFFFFFYPTDRLEENPLCKICHPRNQLTVASQSSMHISKREFVNRVIQAVLKPTYQ